jgi:phosphoribosylformylglycinamidine cyclo-ligase
MTSHDVNDRSVPSVSYADAGVDYHALDPAKVLAQQAAAETAANLERWGVREVASSRGQTAYVWEEADCYRAVVLECLGTKVLVANETRAVTGQTYYDALAQDAVAMMVNDLAAVGAQPQVVAAYWAAGSSEWFADGQRVADLVRGWAQACNSVGATWAGGETPALTGVVEPGAVDLAGACVGIVRPKSRLMLGDRLAPGAAIVVVESSGIHANGLSLARHVAQRVPAGYATDIGDGSVYGHALLRPTHLYPRLVAEMFDAGIDIHYLANITGHGWRKIMRAPKELTYVIDRLPPIPRVMSFIQEHTGLDNHTMYSTFNMGAGFVVFAAPEHASRVVSLASGHRLQAWECGSVETGPRRVVIRPLDVTYEYR